MLEKITVSKGWDWTIVVLEEETGLFLAHGSFGTYGHVWPPQHRSKPLKVFLSGLHKDYFFGKVKGRAAKRFDARKTAIDVKRFICEVRREGSVTKETARLAWSDVMDIDPMSSADLFLTAFTASTALMEVYGGDYCDVARESYTAECDGFWSEMWPEFLKLIEPAERAAA